MPESTSNLQGNFDHTTPRWFEWYDTGQEIRRVNAHAVYSEAGAFLQWVVHEGTAPPDLTQEDALVPAVNWLKVNRISTVPVVASDVTIEAWEENGAAVVPLSDTETDDITEFFRLSGPNGEPIHEEDPDQTNNIPSFAVSSTLFTGAIGQVKAKATIRVPAGGWLIADVSNVHTNGAAAMYIRYNLEGGFVKISELEPGGATTTPTPALQGVFIPEGIHELVVLMSGTGTGVIGVDIQQQAAAGGVFAAINDLVETQGICNLSLFYDVLREDGSKAIFDSVSETTYLGSDLALVGFGNNTRCKNPTGYSEHVAISPAYIQECSEFEVVIPISQDATFSDNTGPENTVSFTTQATAGLFDNEVRKALEFEQAEILNNRPVTPFIITVDGGTYEFPPSAVLGRSGNSFTIDQAEVTTWFGDGTQRVFNFGYSVFSNCTCRVVEMIQSYDSTGRAILVSIVDPATSSIGGEKEQLVYPLPFGSNGPFAGPCPSSQQVLELSSLCCNDDLETQDEIVQQRFAWLDGSGASVMLDAIGGNPIAGNDGDAVFEIQDKVNPGVEPSVTLDPAPGSQATYRADVLNGLSVLEFDGVDDRASLDNAGRANGTAFTIFMLLRVRGGAAFAQPLSCRKLVGPFDNEGEWVVSRGSGPSINDFNLAYSTSPSTAVGGVISTWNEFANGDFRLLTIEYTGNTENQLRAYLDGQLRVELDTTGFDLTSQGIGIMRNRANNSFVEGDIAEYFVSDELTSNQVAAVNAYLICKWGIDPSLAAGGAGDLVLGEPGEFSGVTPFRRIERSDGTVVYLNTINGLEFPVPPVPGLAICAIDPTSVNLPNATVGEFVPIVLRETAAGTIPAARQKVSIFNDGNADGTVEGVVLKPQTGIVFEAYLNPVSNVYTRPGEIDYDATGTEFLIAITP